MKRFVFGVVAVLVSLLGAYWMEGGNILALILPSPFIISFFVPFFAVLAVWSPKAWGRAWRDAFSPQPDPKARAASARLWDFYERICYASAVLALMLGLVIIFSSNPAWPGVAESFATGFTEPVFAVFFAIVARILRHRVEAI